MSGLLDSEVRWQTITNLDNSAPFGEAAALLIKSFCSSGETVEALSRVFVLGAADHDEAFVELDTSVDATFLEELDEVFTLGGCLVDCLFEHDDAGDVFFDAGGSEEDLTVVAAICLVIFNVDGAEAVADSASGFISSEDTFASCADFVSGLDEFSFELKFRVDHCEDV